MLRRLKITLTALSAIVLLISIPAAAISFHHAIRLPFRHRGVMLEIRITSGVLELTNEPQCQSDQRNWASKHAQELDRLKRAIEKDQPVVEGSAATLGGRRMG